MKLVKMNPKSLILSPKRLFRKRRSQECPTKSDPPSFGSGTTSTSSSTSDLKSGLEIGSATPQSVLPEPCSDFMDRDALESLLSRLGAGSGDDRLVVAAMLSEVGSEPMISVEALVSRAGLEASESESESELREAFEFFDADRDGKISAEELLRFYEAIGDHRCTLEDCRRMIAGVDSVGDGFVCFADFSRMMDLQRL